MLFSDLYKSPRSPLAKLRHHSLSHPAPSLALAGADVDADLLSRDKTRNKEAVRRHLADKVRNDWTFTWPPDLPPPVHDRHGAMTVEQPRTAETSLTPAETSPPAATAATAADPLDADHDADRDSGAEADSETDSVYSTVSEDAAHFRPRAEWTSDLSDDDRRHDRRHDDDDAAPPSPFRFDSPDAVGAAVRASAGARRRRRRREVRAEMRWNHGLACFTARRDAWTGAQTVRVKPRLPSPVSPLSPRRGLWRFHSHPSRAEAATLTGPSMSPQPPPPPAAAPSPRSPGACDSRHSRHSQYSAADTTTPPTSDRGSHESTGSQRSSEPTAPLAAALAPASRHADFPVETLLPIPPPLLPAANPMRASITPAIYTSLYDKVVVHSLQPSCPVNLADMLRACVAGWKRDGEWPPRLAELPPDVNVVVVRRKKKDVAASAAAASAAAAAAHPARRLSISAFLSRGGGSPERDDDAGAGKGIRRSFQRVFGLGHGRSASLGSVNNDPVKEEATAAV